jgi:ligand-binding sensor domain-containing protein
MWQALIPRLERDELTPSLHSAATRHLGAIFDDASTLQLLLKMSRDSESFARGLLEENLAALADRSAAIRVTAVTWLHGQNVAVDGYDAMGSKVDRRRAVRRYLTAQEAARQATEQSAMEAGR